MVIIILTQSEIRTQFIHNCLPLRLNGGCENLFQLLTKLVRCSSLFLRSALIVCSWSVLSCASSSVYSRVLLSPSRRRRRLCLTPETLDLKRAKRPLWRVGTSGAPRPKASVLAPGPLSQDQSRSTTNILKNDRSVRNKYWTRLREILRLGLAASTSRAPPPLRPWF